MLPAALTLALTAMLVWIIIDDLKNYRIKNINVIACLLLTASIFMISKSFQGVIANGLFAAFLFPLLILAYARNAMGGGDVKLLTVAFFGVGPALSLLFATSLLVCILAYWAAVRLEWAPFQRVGGRLRVPFGPSIAGAWIVTILASAAG